MNKKELSQVADFIYEAGMLAKTPRSGLWYLGSGAQSVAEHSYRTALIGYALSQMSKGVNTERVVLLCLFHDLAEGRTSDLNYVHQKYGRLAEARAMDDIATAVPFGANVKNAYDEAHARTTKEAKIAKDADNLEWLATLREEEEKGNKKAHAWAAITCKRLKTAVGKRIGEHLVSTHPDAWWFDENDQWFVDRTNVNEHT